MHDLAVDKSFNLEKTFDYILSIQVSLDGFSFSVINPIEHQLVAFKNAPLKISSNSLLARRFEEWIKTEDIFGKPFKKIRIIVFTNLFTLIPEKYTALDARKEISNLVLGNNSETEVAEIKLDNLHSTLLFSLPPGLNEIIGQYFSDYEISHPIQLVTGNGTELKDEFQLILVFDSNSFYLTLLQKDKILVNNSFIAVHANDVIYYILTVIKQFNISSHSLELSYTGITAQESKTISTLKKYFPKTKKLDNKNAAQIDSESFPDITNEILLIN